MARFRKRPVEVEAVQWTGTEESLQQIFDLIPKDKEGHFDLPGKEDSQYVGGPGIGYLPAFGQLEIPTLEGIMIANLSDWIIRGVKDEIYPCKPDIFDLIHEPVEPSLLDRVVAQLRKGQDAKA